MNSQEKVLIDILISMRSAIDELLETTCQLGHDLEKKIETELIIKELD